MLQPRDVGFADGRIRCMFPELGRMVGFAATATIVARGDPGPDWAGAGNDALYSHVRTVPAPRIVVVRDLDDPPAHGSLWGEVHATIFGALGCVGCVTDGAVRDLDEARGMGFHFFAAGPSVSHAYVRVETVGAPVEIGGLVVAPGDLLHADRHGVLKIPLELAAGAAGRRRSGHRDRAGAAAVGTIGGLRPGSPGRNARPALTDGLGMATMIRPLQRAVQIAPARSPGAYRFMKLSSVLDLCPSV